MIWIYFSGVAAAMLLALVIQSRNNVTPTNEDLKTILIGSFIFSWVTFLAFVYFVVKNEYRYWKAQP